MRVVLVDRRSAHPGSGGDLGVSDLINPAVEEQCNRSVKHCQVRTLDSRINGGLGCIWV